MAGTHFLPDDTGSTKRPDLIATLGVLTFINAGVFTLLYALGILVMLAVRTMPMEDYTAMMVENASWLPEESRGAMESMSVLLYESGAVLMLILFMRTVLRLIGAMGMWKGRRWGFHVYAAAQLGGIFAPHLVLPWAMLGMLAPLLAVGMTALYGTQLKRLS